MATLRGLWQRLERLANRVKTIDTRVDSLQSLDAYVYKGAIDASANPNYPAANAGDVYRMSVAGKIGGASGPEVPIGAEIICRTDGTATGNHATVGAHWDIYSDINSTPYDLSGQVDGEPTADQVILRVPIIRPCTLLATLHKGVAAVAATAETDLLVQVNGVTKATLRFAAAGTTTTIVSPTATDCVAGDVVTVVAPTVPDATLADVAVTLAVLMK